MIYLKNEINNKINSFTYKANEEISLYDHDSRRVLHKLINMINFDLNSVRFSIDEKVYKLNQYTEML